MTAVYNTRDYKVGGFYKIWKCENVYAVTIKVKPERWKESDMIINDLKKRAKRNKEDFVLYAETGKTENLHYHGIYITDKWDSLRKYINRNIGFVHKSVKGDCNGWEAYCRKGVKENEGNAEGEITESGP